MKKQVHVYYSGRVQGVGFRYTVDRLARHFDVTGYVKNCSDGRVELLCEGRENVLNDFLAAIKKSPMEHHIDHADITWNEPESQYKVFGVAF